MLVIDEPADDPNLLTIEQARVAVGLAEADTSRDEQLQSLLARVSADIYAACRIKRGSGAPLTLRQETVTETFFYPGGTTLPLARRHEIELTSLAINGSAQSLSTAVVRPDAGLVELVSDRLTSWPKGRVVAVYKAGFDEVPEDLVSVASDLLRLKDSATSRDPLVKRVRIDVDGVDETETDYWVPSVGSASSSASGLPADIMARLSRYRNAAIA